MELNEKEGNTINIIATGCIHGVLNKMYNDIQNFEKEKGINIDLVLCTGDFESMRDKKDLNFLACPEKYRELGDFYQYYTGEKVAPYLTIFIGGNHEASNYLEQNFFGGYVAKNIYYLGRAGVINVKGLRIAGLSGIFKVFDYFKGHFEKNENDICSEKKSIFHLREFEIAKLSHIKNKIDILMTHDWPTNIIEAKDVNKICKIKPHWKSEIKNGSLGSYPGEFLLRHLKPHIFICSHMHYYYNTKVDDISIYALDKCLPRRQYFQLIETRPSIKEISKTDNNIYIDKEWCAISKAFNEYFPTDYGYYSFLNLFEENSQLLYNSLVMNKLYREIKINEMKNPMNSIISGEEIEQTIKKLLDEKYKESKPVSIEINKQKDVVLTIFDIKLEENKNVLFYSLNKNEEVKNNNNTNNIQSYKSDSLKNPDEIDFGF